MASDEVTSQLLINCCTAIFKCDSGYNYSYNSQGKQRCSCKKASLCISRKQVPDVLGNLQSVFLHNVGVLSIQLYKYCHYFQAIISVCVALCSCHGKIISSCVKAACSLWTATHESEEELSQPFLLWSGGCKGHLYVWSTMDFQSFLSSEDKSVKQTILESCSVHKFKKKKKRKIWSWVIHLGIYSQHVYPGCGVLSLVYFRSKTSITSIIFARQGNSSLAHPEINKLKPMLNNQKSLANVLCSHQQTSCSPQGIFLSTKNTGLQQLCLALGIMGKMAVGVLCSGASTRAGLGAPLLVVTQGSWYHASFHCVG